MWVCANMHVCACEPCVFVVYTCIIGCMEDHVETVVSRDGPFFGYQSSGFYTRNRPGTRAVEIERKPWADELEKNMAVICCWYLLCKLTIRRIKPPYMNIHNMCLYLKWKYNKTKIDLYSYHFTCTFLKGYRYNTLFYMRSYNIAWTISFQVVVCS